jgi:hypothetical protein
VNLLSVIYEEIAYVLESINYRPANLGSLSTKNEEINYILDFLSHASFSLPVKKYRVNLHDHPSLSSTY